jgi:hypothetical protein
MERDEDNSVADATDSQLTLNLAACAGDFDEVAFAEVFACGVCLRHLDPDLRGGGVELGRPGGLGARVEVIQRATRGELVRKLRAGLPMRPNVFGGFDDGLAVRVQAFVFILVLGGAGDHVLAVGLAGIGRRTEELAVGIQPFGAGRCALVARPLNAAGSAEQAIADAGVVTRPSGAAPLPCLER